MWRALKTGSVSGWFKNGEDGLLEALMSVTGTVVIGELERAPDGKGKSNTITPKPPLVGIAEVLYGPRPEQGGKVRMYRCIPGNQDADGCLNPVEKAQGEAGEDGEFKGMIERVKQLMLGDAAKGQVGILEKLRFGSGTPSDAEASFMQILPIGAQLGNLARQNHGMAVQFAEAAAPLIATGPAGGHAARHAARGGRRHDHGRQRLCQRVAGPDPRGAGAVGRRAGVAGGPPRQQRES